MAWRTTFSVKADILRYFNKTEFVSEGHVQLKDLFVFLRLTCDVHKETDHIFRDSRITTPEELLERSYALIYGQENSGKTALARYLFTSLVDRSQPVLFVDSDATVAGRRRDTFFRDVYLAQFHGDYDLWVKQENKTLIIDDMTSTPRMLQLVTSAKDIFERIIITVSSDVYYSFFTDEPRLADFHQMKIEPLTRGQQETLIRKRLALSPDTQSITDGYIDQIENHINSIIISKDIVPRFPFYVLSILQTYEGFMPNDISITSYGHCYYVLIVANLSRSGISNADSGFNACFNLAEHLAFAIYQHRDQRTKEPFDFTSFVTKYETRFHIGNSLINRLQHESYGLIMKDGTFRTDYMYYYFLAKFLSNNHDLGRPIINAMCEESYRKGHSLTLLFIIHHTRNTSIIDNILIRTMCTLDSVNPAKLNRVETKQYMSILTKLPDNILSPKNVQEAREIHRVGQDAVDDGEFGLEDATQDLAEIDMVNDVYRILKNNKIMGQVLRNNFGNLEKYRVEEIVEIIADSGLRLVNYFVGDENEVNQYASYIHTNNPDWDIPKIKQALQFISFIWTMVNIDQIVEAINVPEIRQSISAVVGRRSTAAYDLIGYFSQLGGATELTRTERDALNVLLNTYKDNQFVGRVLSLRTQFYMNTHRSAAMIEQSICSLLDIKYRPRLPPGQ